MADAASSLALLDEASVSVLQSTSDTSLTRDGLAADIRIDLNDQGEFYTPEDINDAIQDAYDETCAFTGCIEGAGAIAFNSELTYYDFYENLPEYMAVVAIWNSGSKRWMIPVSLRELDELRWDWEKCSGSPYLFCPVNYRYVAIFPRGADGSMYVFYKKHATTLSGDSVLDIPPDVCGEIISSYVVADMHVQQEEFTKANMSYKGYLEGLDKLVKRIRRFDQERLPRLTS